MTSSSSSSAIPQPPDRSKDMDPPMSNSIALRGHDRAISALHCDPSGARLLTGAWDYKVKFWDFAGMTNTFKSFRDLDPVSEEDHGSYLFNHIRWSTTGDLFVLVKAHPQPILYDRDGHEIFPFCIGDRYLVDQSNSKGHTAEVTGCQWSPNNRATILTGSKDSTVRLWNVETLHKRQVTIIKTAQGMSRNNRAGVTSCGFSNSGGYIYAGTDVGKIFIWPDGGPYSKPKIEIKNAHRSLDAITDVKLLSDGNRLFSRCKDETLKLWDLRKPQSPVMEVKGIDTIYDTCDIAVSPNEDLIVVGSCVDKKSSDRGQLLFYDTKTLKKQYASLVDSGCSVVRIQWHPKLNQIIAGCSNGTTYVYYDRDKSVKGALLCANKVKKIDPVQMGGFSTDIQTPNALPMYREERSNITRKREQRAFLPDRSGVPPRLEDCPSYALLRYSAKHQMYMEMGVAKNTIRNEDPVAKLRSYQKEADENPLYIADVYKKTQPEAVFADPEEDEIDHDDMIEEQVAKKKTKILDELRNSGANRTV